MKNIFTCLFLAFTLTACSNTSKHNPKTVSTTINQANNKQIQKELSKIQSEKKTEMDILVGSYRCKRTKDAYVFYSDNTGQFFPGGKTPCSEFTWKRSGENVTIKYEIFGEQKLKFNQKNKTLTEKSQSFGTLIFEEE